MIFMSCVGISFSCIHKHFHGEVIYNAETDIHFPKLVHQFTPHILIINSLLGMQTVSQTLSFVASTQTPCTRLPGISCMRWAEHMRDVVMAIFGLTHTVNTMVGNNLICGVSGGECK
jgi:ATP-binding cassette, subfamily G (WHITE), member 2, PDR